MNAGAGKQIGSQSEAQSEVQSGKPAETEYLTFAQAAACLPRRPDGSQPSARTVARWAIHGVGGVLLASVKLGRTRYTTAQALADFSASLARQPALRRLSRRRRLRELASRDSARSIRLAALT